MAITRAEHSHTMKLIAILSLAAAAAAAPQQLVSNPDAAAAVLRFDNVDDATGNFNYAFETSNGIAEERQGTVGAVGQSVMRGAYTIPLQGGGSLTVIYTADEFGFQPQGDALPVGPAPAPHDLENIANKERLAAQGVQWDQRGFVIPGTGLQG